MRYYKDVIFNDIYMYEKVKSLNEILRSLAKLDIFGGSYLDYHYDDEYTEPGCRCGYCHITYEAFTLHAWDNDEDYWLEYSNLDQ